MLTEKKFNNGEYQSTPHTYFCLDVTLLGYEPTLAALFIFPAKAVFTAPPSCSSSGVPLVASVISSTPDGLSHQLHLQGVMN